MAHSERLSALEALVNEHSQSLTGLRESHVGLEQRVGAVDERLIRIDQLFDRIDERFDRLEERLAQQFVWIMGMQVTVPLAFVGSVVTLAVMRG